VLKIAKKIIKLKKTPDQIVEVISMPRYILIGITRKTAKELKSESISKKETYNKIIKRLIILKRKAGVKNSKSNC